jgi:hypothetical protein
MSFKPATFLQHGLVTNVSDEESWEGENRTGWGNLA